MDDGPPPWSAPRDAVSYIAAAGLPELPLDSDSDPHIVQISISIDDSGVTIPAYLGVDQLRAVQAPVHTHDESGEVWLEGPGNRDVTLEQFFTVWGVRFSDDCLGDSCGQLTVESDGQLVSDPAQFKLREAQQLTIKLTS